MKLYFRFDLEYTYHCHAMATWLKRDRGMRDEDFRGMVAGRLYHHFLTSIQRDIRYPYLSTYQDLMWRAQTEPPDHEFLARMERELGVDTLWRLVDADRSIQHFTYDQALSAMTIFLKYFWAELTEHRPDAVVSFVSANLSALACYFIARRLGIPYLEFQTARLYRRALVSTEPFNEFPLIVDRYREYLAGRGDSGPFEQARSYVEAFRSAPWAPDGVLRARQITGKSMSLHPRRLIGWLRVNYWWYFGHYRKDIATDPPMKMARDVVRANLSLRTLRRPGAFERDLPSGEPYAYFPLHFQPEMTTMVLAPFWQDQPSLIENVARSLPLGVRLYVKEHVPMLGLRPLGYYERLRRIPNVRLVDPYCSSLALTRGAAVVLTLTGTAGFEAVLLGRPVVTFGRIFYNALDAVQKCRSVEDLPGIIRSCLAERPSDDAQLHAFVAALIEGSFEFDAEQLQDPTRPYESIRDAESTRLLYQAYLALLDRERTGAT